MSIITEQERAYLVNSIKNLLYEYDYDYTTKAINHIIDEWAAAKEDIIRAFKNHPNYLEGQFMIAYDTDYERIINKRGAENFAEYLTSIDSLNKILPLIPTEMDEQRKRDGCGYLPDDVYNFLLRLGQIAERTISDETANKINDMMPTVRAHTGEKTSRVINKICTYLGYTKFDDYNKEFAKYADSLSPVRITRHTILSVNPLDYLTMSFGNSWASCHTIDKSNKRGMPNSYEGQYSSGTMSYMLDPTSMVFYTISSEFNGQEYWNEPKVCRQMFHYGEEKLIQGRLYPQSNDGESGEYTANRNVVQKIIADIYDFPNLWTVKKGVSAIKDYVIKDGTHYPDYFHFDYCTISRQNGSENEDEIYIGAEPICVECGYTHSEEDCINCCSNPSLLTCADCGCDIDDEDAYYVDGEYYCRDCVSYCERCGEYHRDEAYYIDSEERYVCESCYDDYYCRCEECGENICRDDAYWCEEQDGYICIDCYEESYDTCAECGEIFNRDDMKIHNDKWVCSECYDNLIKDEEEAC